MAYADITFNDRNVVKRWLQGRRLVDAIDIADGSHPQVIMDFGAGNGELCKLIVARFPEARVVCYEPSPDLLAEARTNLAGLAGVELVGSLADLKGEQFDVVFCLEVFEHLPERQTHDALMDIRRHLRRGGAAIIGVPVEIGFQALYKGIFRMLRRYGHFDARWSHVLRAMIGRPPVERPVADIAPGMPFHFDHLGFDYRRLELDLAGYFTGCSKRFTPFSGIGSLVSPEVYFRAVND